MLQRVGFFLVLSIGLVSFSLQTRLNVYLARVGPQKAEALGEPLTVGGGGGGRKYETESENRRYLQKLGLVWSSLAYLQLALKILEAPKKKWIVVAQLRPA